MVRAISETDDTTDVDLDNLIVMFAPGSDDPISQAARDIIAAAVKTATEDAEGLVELATAAEMNAGTVGKIPDARRIADYIGNHITNWVYAEVTDISDLTARLTAISSASQPYLLYFTQAVAGTITVGAATRTVDIEQYQVIYYRPSLIDGVSLFKIPPVGGSAAALPAENIGTAVTAVTTSWTDYAIDEAIERNREYQFVLQRGSDSDAITLTASFYGSELLDLPANAGGGYTDTSESDQLGLPFGRIDGGGAGALSVARNGSNAQSLRLRTFNNAYRAKELSKLPSRGGDSAGTSGGGITLDEAIDGVGAILAALDEFTYDAATNTLTFAILDNTILPAKARANSDAHKEEWRTRIGALARTNETGIIFDIEPGYINTPSLVGSYMLNILHLPTSFDSGINRLKIVMNATGGRADPTIHTELTWAPATGIINFDIDATEAEAITAALGGTVPTSGRLDGEIRFQTGNGVTTAVPFNLPIRPDITGTNDSSSDHDSQDHERISDLEERTQELVLHDHTNWEDETAVAQYAVAIVPAGTSLTTDSLPGQSWGLSDAAGSDGNFLILLRTAQGRSPNAIRIAHTGSTPVGTYYRGGFRFLGLEQDGFDYYVHSSVAMVTGDTLTVQRGTVDAHTAYRGRVDLLDVHEANTFAHQDSPVRVENLPVGAPAGRQVYLTATHTHPPTETIFSVPLEFIGGTTGFVGATVADLSSIGGPTAATNQASYPAIMNAARVAGIWQPLTNHGGIVQRLRRIYVAVLGSIGTPTHMHISGFDDRRFDLEAVTSNGTPVTINLGGNVHRVLQTTVEVYAMLATVTENGNPLTFSLEYGTGFLAADGTIDTGGADHAIGHYEAITGGQWRTRSDSIISLLVAELANASDADKYTLVSALYPDPEILYTDASARVFSRESWTVIELNRDLTAADDDKIMRIRFWNSEADNEVFARVSRIRAITAQDRTNSNIVQRPVVIPFSSGDTDSLSAQQIVSPLIIGRPTDATNPNNKIMLGSRAFGDGNNHAWKSAQVSVELRSLF